MNFKFCFLHNLEDYTEFGQSNRDLHIKLKIQKSNEVFFSVIEQLVGASLSLQFDIISDK